MSWRAIQDTVGASVTLAQLSHGAERLHWRMLAYTDPHGRMVGEAVKIRALCMPLVRVTDRQIDAWLEELAAAGRIVRYTEGGKQYVAFVDFEANQPTEFLRRRGDSKYPAPPKTPRLQGTPGSSGTSPGHSRLEGEGEEKEKTPPPVVPLPDIERVYGHWRTARGKTRSSYDEMSAERRRVIRERLREFPADELIRAIDAVALDPWEERPRHDDLVTIFKKRSSVERFLDLADNPPRSNGHRADALLAEARADLAWEREAIGP